MSGAAFILAINLVVAGLFCATFVLIALYDRACESARWFALAYAFGAANQGFEALLPLLSNPKFAAYCGYIAFLAALAALNIGIARRYGLKVPRTLLATAFVVSVIVAVLVQQMPRDAALRLFLYQAPYFLMQAIGVAIVLRARERRPADNLLAGLLLLSALHYLSKPVFALSFGGVGASPGEYLGTTYAMFSQTMSAVLAMATAMLLLAMLVADIVRDITARSETDALSGLLNRRGFEDRLERLASARMRRHLPVALVICDLDHFKSVNDTHGHAVGDSVIARFAAILRDVACDHHVLGRIGGEEFAVILPGGNLPTARLFAESARAAFAALVHDGLPETVRFTASFGVAELIAGEAPGALLARADAALYEAKRAGRDRVRVCRDERVVDEGPDGAGDAITGRRPARRR